MAELYQPTAVAAWARGHRARWTAALVLAPSAAALFSATMSWASATRPATVAPPPAPAAAATPAAPATPSGESAAARDLRRALAARQAKRDDLVQQLAAVRSHLDQLKAAERRARARAASIAAGQASALLPSSNGGYVQPPAAQPAPVQAAPVQAAPVQAAPVQAAPVQAAPPPPPPPVQATTGASGQP
jgi:ribonuclease E